MDESTSTLVDHTLYRSIAGVLQCLTLTRPYLAFAVNQACQHMHRPAGHHFTALKCILRYMKGSLLFGLHIQRDVFNLLHFRMQTEQGIILIVASLQASMFTLAQLLSPALDIQTPNNYCKILEQLGKAQEATNKKKKTPLSLSPP
ncbi:Retrovirus-related Pol polyprotein from transposon TNT 1-94 [Cinnamomum micranthum f. kanehirae]|uniref:Retrovirus-related Pol polyprotein from transposon TNT 1-94 n=1 Tax=Cinnamomum micranthum f. kanehirae TaxID=337451 RepID=A0A3S3N9L8_9MAGN|nr:Retrovirus-related Pol polyprotein from transposon TNT 1-94 [Cinnamomum micranthum f. kanehirae]